MNFKRYLSFPLLLMLPLLISGFDLSAQNYLRVQQQALSKESGVEMLEISKEKLPEKIIKNIGENYVEAEIAKAYKVWRPGVKNFEYWVDVRQGPKRWSLQFEENGTAITKSNP